MASGVNRPMFLTKVYQAASSKSISNRDSVIFTQNDFGFSIPAGYSIYGIMDIVTDSSVVTTVRCVPSYDNFLILYNYSSSSVSVRPIVRIMFIRSDLLS